MAKPRDYRLVKPKMAREIGCRVCGKQPFEWAHTLGRTYDRRSRGLVNPNLIIPLCGPFPLGCHGDYDAHQLDISAVLTLPELEAAIKEVGQGLAARRIRSSRQAHDLEEALQRARRVLALGR